MQFKSKRDEALATLHLLKARQVLVANRGAGWDRKLQSQIMHAVVRYAGGSAGDSGLLHLEFLDALISMIEAEEVIFKAISREQPKPSVEELA